MEQSELFSLSNIKLDEDTEVVDFDPAMILVSAEADEATDRIVDYLASKAQLPIETVNFTYATLHGGQEVLVRIITVPDAPLTTSVRRSRSTSDIVNLAEERDISILVETLRSIKDLEWREHPLKSRGGCLQYWVKTPDGDRVVFNMNVGGARWNTPKGSLDIKILLEVLSASSELTPSDVLAKLGQFTVLNRSEKRVWIRISDENSAKALLVFLKEWDATRVKPDDSEL